MGGITRRQLLAFTAAAGALSVGAAGVLVARLPRLPPPQGLRWLDGNAAAVLERLARIWLPDGRGPFVDQAQLAVLPEFDAWFGRLAPALRSDFGKGLTLFNYGAVVFGWHFRAFIELEEAEFAPYLQGWWEGNAQQRSLVAALRQVLLLSYWRHPQTWPATGYQGPLHLRADIPRLGPAPVPR